MDSCWQYLTGLLGEKCLLRGNYPLLGMLKCLIVREKGESVMKNVCVILAVLICFVSSASASMTNEGDITFEKFVNTDTAFAGDMLIYEVVLTNNTTGVLSGVELIDVLDGCLQLQLSSLAISSNATIADNYSIIGKCDVVGIMINCLPVQDPVTINFEAIIESDTPVGFVIENEAMVNGLDSNMVTTVVTATVIPEPLSLAMLACGSIAMFNRRRCLIVNMAK